MRCPKCGYNSFDHLDSCKKCGTDLVEYKQRFGIRSVLFPGQMVQGDGGDEAGFDSVVADAAVEAATGAAEVAAAETAVAEAVSEPAAAEGDSDDFGFDFMGDSAEDDDLSFDELFEEAPEDEDIEETIEGPKEAAAAETGSADSSDSAPADDELEDDFGFDPAAEEDDFSFDDETESNEEADSSGTGEDPQRPFDLPESSQFVGAPVDSPTVQDEVSSVSESGVAVESDTVPVPPRSEPEEMAQLDIFAEEPVVVDSPLPVPLAAEVAEVVEPVEPEEAESVAAPVPLPAAETSEELLTPAVGGDAGVSLPSLAGSIGAFLCDFAIIAVVSVSFIVAAETAMSSQSGHYLPSVATLIDLSIPYFLVIFFLTFGYFTLFHFLAGQTPGKMVAGLRVETIDGEPLAFSQAFLRSVGGLLQLLPAGLGYLLVLMSSDRRGWNDRLAGTRVVAL